VLYHPKLLKEGGDNLVLPIIRRISSTSLGRVSLRVISALSFLTFETPSHHQQYSNHFSESSSQQGDVDTICPASIKM